MRYVLALVVLCGLAMQADAGALTISRTGLGDAVVFESNSLRLAGRTVIADDCGVRSLSLGARFVPLNTVVFNRGVATPPIVNKTVINARKIKIKGRR